MNKPVSAVVVSAKVAQSKRDDAQRLYHALAGGRLDSVSVEVGYNFEDDTFRVRGLVDGVRISFIVDKTDAPRAELCARRLRVGAARQLLANLALDVWNPEGKKHREAVGYPGVALCAVA